MTKKYCINCNLVLDEEVKFCPECGGQVQKYKKSKSKKPYDSKKPFNKKRLIVILLIILGIIVVAIVAFAIIQNIMLKNNASSAKSSVNNKAGVETFSENIGNLSGNIAADAYSVTDGNYLYYVGQDGIYKSNNFNDKEINKDNSKKIADGKFSSLNYYGEKIICIRNDDNSIYKLSDLNDEDKQPYVDNIYTAEPGFTFKSVAINSDNIYVLSESSGNFYITSTNMRSKNKINDVWSGAGTQAWMYLSEFTLRVCVASSSGWEAYKGDIDGNKTSGLSKYCSGSGNPTSVGFYDDKIYLLHSGTSLNSSSISVYESGGNRNAINLDCSAKKLLLSGETVFIQSSNDRFIWFNVDTNMSHDIDNKLYKDIDVNSININKGKFCVIYSDNSVVLSDIASLN